MNFKLINLKNAEYKDLNIIIKSMENLGYINTTDFYISITNKVLVIYDNKTLEDSQVKELLLEHLI